MVRTTLVFALIMFSGFAQAGRHPSHKGRTKPLSYEKKQQFVPNKKSRSNLHKLTGQSAKELAAPPPKRKLPSPKVSRVNG